MPNATSGSSIASSAQINPGVVENSDLAADAVKNNVVASNAAIAYSKLNLSGGVVNADINASAAIADTKLDTISTAGKVSGAALTSLANTPSGAGRLPSANVPASGSLSAMKVFGSSPLNRYIGSPTTNASPSTSTPGTGIMIFTPFFVPESITLDQLAIGVDTLGVGVTARIGIYDSVAGYPTNLIVGSAALDCGSAGVKTETINQTLTAGLYWLAYTCSGVVTLVSYTAAGLGILGVASTLTGTAGSSWEADFTYAALPATAPTTNRAVGNRSVCTFVRRSA